MSDTAKAKMCHSCGGRGVINPGGRNPSTCPTCAGQGQIQQPVLRVPFEYIVNVTNGAGTGGALAANQQGVLQSLQINQDADFEWIWRMYSSTGLFSLLVQDGATGRYFMNAACNAEIWGGNAQLPFPLLEPYIIARTATVNFEFNDRSAAINAVQVNLSGYKLFPASAPMQGSSGTIVQST